MDSLFLIDILDKTAYLFSGVFQVGVFIEINFLLFDRTNDALGVSVLRGFADFGHADLDSQSGQAPGVVGGGVLNSLIGVVNLWAPSSEPS